MLNKDQLNSSHFVSQQNINKNYLECLRNMYNVTCIQYLPTAPLTVPYSTEPWVDVLVSPECCITKEPEKSQ